MSNQLLVIANNWPESTTTAAGVHLLFVLNSFKKQGFSIHFACSSQPSTYSDSLEGLVDNTYTIVLNNESFNELLLGLNPDIVLFDRFLSEEQYGWRVYDCCPHALTILNTEDVHSLRDSRAKGLNLDQWKTSDLFYRECASFLRVDKVLLISSVEMDLFQSISWIDTEKFIYVPIVSQRKIDSKISKPSGECVFFGSGKHPANIETLNVLMKWWPKIKAELPYFELSVFGAYYSSHLIQQLSKIDGIHFKGWVKDIDSKLTSMRYLIAPIPFGAGLKGKVLKAIENKVLVLTSSVGSEGIDIDQKSRLMHLNSCEDYISALYTLDTDNRLYESNLEVQNELLNRFSQKNNSNWVALAVHSPDDNSKIDHPQLKRLLRHQTINASKNLGKYLTLKNLLKAKK